MGRGGRTKDAGPGGLSGDGDAGGFNGWPPSAVAPGSGAEGAAAPSLKLNDGVVIGRRGGKGKNGGRVGADAGGGAAIAGADGATATGAGAGGGAGTSTGAKSLAGESLTEAKSLAAIAGSSMGGSFGSLGMTGACPPAGHDKGATAGSFSRGR